MNHITKSYDLVVVGGGLSGVCAAIAAARHGVRTALIQNRAMYGGNASSEIRVHINGAGRNHGFKNAIESGIILELLMENMKRNPQHSFSLHDRILWEKVEFQENLDSYLNTNLEAAQVEDGTIQSITAVQNTTETIYTFYAKLFADTTGDATLAALSGADYTIGRESRDTYGESLAPKVADEHTMGNTILFSTVDMKRPVPFHRPAWAYEYTKEMLKNRKIGVLTHGYWWIELGGDWRSTITDAEEIQKELMKYVYGVFDYIKNSKEYDADNLAIDWIATIPGKRESRRVYGDYVLNQNDIDAVRRFEDTIAYGGWTMDAHTIGGIEADHEECEEGTVWNPVQDVYTIPYRCIYSRNVKNLYVGGRAISASHMAMSSTRVMSTCAVIGQAIGTAAAIAVREQIMPREVLGHIKELQQTLIKDDCYLPGIACEDHEELITNKSCTITASGYENGCEPSNINGAFARRIEDKEYAWVSEKMKGQTPWLKATFQEPVSISKLLLRFDPNFSKPMFITLDQRIQAQRDPEMPKELVRDYKITFMKENEIVKEILVTDNYQRVNHHQFESIECDSVLFTGLKTYGDAHIRLYDLRLYE